MSPVRPTVTVIAAEKSPEGHRLRDFLTRIAQPYDLLEASLPAGSALLAHRSLSEDDLPVLIDGEEVLTRVDPTRLAVAWQIHTEPSRSHYDMAIVGAGPAGLAAAVYAASDGLSTIVFEREVPGGQASHTSLIENFFGFPEGIGGAELARMAGRQAERFGAELMIMSGLDRGEHEADGRSRLHSVDGWSVTADVTVAAPGMVWRRLDVPGVDELLERGVYYGAGRSEAISCGGHDVVVIGAGNSAGQAVMHLAGAGARVQMVVRGDSLRKSMSAYLVDRIERMESVEVRLRSRVVELFSSPDRWLTGVAVEDAGGGRVELPARALFICIGGEPRTGWAADAGIRTDDRGYLLTGPDLLVGGSRPEGWPLSRDPLVLELSTPGLFAAGDVRHGSIKRVGGAVGEGATAVALAHRRLEELEQAG